MLKSENKENYNNKKQNEEKKNKNRKNICRASPQGMWQALQEERATSIKK